MSINKLIYWENVLSRQGYECQFFQEDSEVHYPRLNINLGADAQGRVRTLEIRIDHYILPPRIQRNGGLDIEESSNNSEEELVIHLFVALPFLIKPGAVGEVSRLLMLLNKPLDMPGFGLDEQRKLVFFRYSLFTYRGHQSVRVLCAIIGMIMLLIDSLTPQIESVAAGATIRETLSAFAHSLTHVD